MAPSRTNRKKKRSSRLPEPLPVILPARNSEGNDSDNDSLTFEIDINAKTAKIISTSGDVKIKSRNENTKEKEGFSLKNSNIKKGENSRNLPVARFRQIESYNLSPAPPMPNHYIRFIEKSSEDLDGQIEYDLDEDDMIWLDIINEKRSEGNLPAVAMDIFELLMDRLEKESYFHVKMNKEADSSLAVIDDEAVCSICLDGECQNSNVILFCDMCNLAVHQDCYGVPYIPEGHWLCRRCLHSPSTAVDCVLCPNNGGAFKQTDRGHWAHIVCSLWIPEVRFANTVFLEPIDSIESIPTARWRLTCYICKQRGVGACIQCHRTNCYSAFHVTCAQQAGLYMKMETAEDNALGAVLVQKIAYCDVHTPANAENKPCLNAMDKKKKSLTPSPVDKVKNARKALAKKRSLVPVISIPTIPPERIQEIASLINIPKKAYFMQRLIAYWTLKRQFRHGVPLIRRLQSYHSARRDEPKQVTNVDHLQDQELVQLQQKYGHHVRQDLERVRLLCELIQKRERKKKERVLNKEERRMLELNPFKSFLDSIVQYLKSKDTGEVFLEPVNVEEVPDYRDFIKYPMDLQTIEMKVNNMEYSTINDFESDFNLMIENCLYYNSKETMFYRAALRMREQGVAIFKEAKEYISHNPFDPVTGLFKNQPLELEFDDEEDDEHHEYRLVGGILSESIVEMETSPSEQVHAKEIDDELKAIAKADTNENNLLIKLLQLEEKCKLIKHKGARQKRIRAIKMQMSNIKRRLLLLGKPYTPAYTPNYAPFDESFSYDIDDAIPSRVKETPELYATPVLDKNFVSRSKRGRRRCNFDRPPVLSDNRTDQIKTNDKGQADNEEKEEDEEELGRIKRLRRRKKNEQEEEKEDEEVQETIQNKRSRPPGRRSKIPATGKTNFVPSNDSVVAGPSTSKGPSSALADSDPQPSTSSGYSRKSRSRFMNKYKNALLNSDSFKVYRLRGEESEEESRSEDESSTSSRSSSSSDDSSYESTESEDEANNEEVTDPDNDDEPDNNGDNDSNGNNNEDSDSDSSEPDDDQQCRGISDSQKLQPVWAKCTGPLWLPALIVDPKMPRDYVHNGVPIPSPPKDVLDLAATYGESGYLVLLLYGAKRTWQWLSRNKVQRLGVDKELDEMKLAEYRKPSEKKSARKAYREALVHRTDSR